MSLPAYVLNKTAGIERHDSSFTPDAYGEATGEYSTADEFFAINVQMASAEKRSMLGSTGIDVTHMGYMNPWTGDEFTEKDRLIIDGVRYYIHSINDPAGLGHHWELQLVSAKDGGL